MKWREQVRRVSLAGILMISPLLHGQAYRSPDVVKSRFSDQLGMLNREREEYARNIVIYASNRAAAEERKGHSLLIARRLIGLSLHLTPKNSSAVNLDRRLKDGEIPPKTQSEYSDSAFSGLMLERSKSLLQQGGNENAMLSLYLVELAAMIDPKNKEVINAVELQRIEKGSLSWQVFTGG